MSRKTLLLKRCLLATGASVLGSLLVISSVRADSNIVVNASADTNAAHLLDLQAARQAATSQLARINQDLDALLRKQAADAENGDLAPLVDDGLAPLVEDPADVQLKALGAARSAARARLSNVDRQIAEALARATREVEFVKNGEVIVNDPVDVAEAKRQDLIRQREAVDQQRQAADERAMNLLAAEKFDASAFDRAVASAKQASARMASIDGQLHSLLSNVARVVGSKELKRLVDEEIGAEPEAVTPSEGDLSAERSGRRKLQACEQRLKEKSDVITRIGQQANICQSSGQDCDQYEEPLAKATEEYFPLYLQCGSLRDDFGGPLQKADTPDAQDKRNLRTLVDTNEDNEIVPLVNSPRPTSMKDSDIVPLTGGSEQSEEDDLELAPLVSSKPPTPRK